MKDTTDDTVIDKLRGALNGDHLPPAARQYAEHLYSRLSAPVRVTLLGLPGSGKSQLINVFAGKPIMVEGTQFPTTELTHGPVDLAKVTAPTGQASEVPFDQLSSVNSDTAAFLQIESPAKMLERVCLLEVVTDGTMEELRAAVDWAVQRTDIALWCTQTFDTDEQALWARVPDALKDHAFMVLTKADVLSAERKLAKQIHDLEAIVAEEFHSLFAVATKQALQAYDSDGSINDQILHASGGGALIAEVQRHAERGRRADFDSAHLFLARYNLQDVSPVAGDPNEAPKPPELDSMPKRALSYTPEVATAPVASAAPQNLEAPAVVAKNPSLFSDAVRFIRRRGDNIAEGGLSQEKVSPIVSQCIGIVEYLSDSFSQDDDDCDAVDQTLDDLADANDMLVLMQIENDTASAADAMTLMLQLRREIESKIAA
ncbi:MAG: hypothetical protein AAF742_06185 [Pseudomonadota bacterium]